jgi:hypothetical protein
LSSNFLPISAILNFITCCGLQYKLWFSLFKFHLKVHTYIDTIQLLVISRRMTCSDSLYAQVCVRLLWHDPDKVSTSLAKWWIVIYLFWRTISVITLHFHVLLQDGSPECSASLMNSTLELGKPIRCFNFAYYFSLISTFNISWVSVPVLPSLKQNLPDAHILFLKFCHFLITCKLQQWTAHNLSSQGVTSKRH